MRLRHANILQMAHFLQTETEPCLVRYIHLLHGGYLGRMSPHLLTGSY